MHTQEWASGAHERTDTPLVIAIDDNPAVGQLVQLAARRMQPVCSVLSATSGIGGLELVRAHAAEVRVVVLDVRMPDLDGRWLCSEIRRLAPLAQILPLTADKEGGAFMGRFGALPPLGKPVGERALAAALTQALTLAPPAPLAADLAAFFGEQLPQQLAAAQQRGAQVRVALMASELLRVALRAVLPTANSVIAAEGRTAAELQPLLAGRLVQLVVASADCTSEALALAHHAHLPLLVCATTTEAPTLPATLNVVSSIDTSETLTMALSTVATGGTYREIAARHRLLLTMTPRQQQVIDLVLAGHSREVVAEELQVSYDHIGHILAGLYRHLGVSSFRQLRAWLAEHGG